MTPLYFFNTLSRTKEQFQPIKPGEVGLYTCGPTVYNFAHLGNLRTYLFEDILVRVLKYNGYKVKRVMNITDVGHLTGDRDMGEDKLEKGARREGKSAWDIAAYYTDSFKADMKRLNLLEPEIWCKATDEIPGQIGLIATLEKKGFTYKTSDGVYFDTSKFSAYNKLSHLNLEELKEGARVEKNDEKRHPTDFALWKFSYPGGRDFDPATDDPAAKRQMEWPSPWGAGFPGWHLECSAMSMRHLGDQLDIHCGGIDHINVHHTNEIAQSEAATEKPFFKLWMHGAFLNIAGGKKMAKSEDNFLTLENALVKNGIDPLAYRFATLGTHYRKPMEYSDEAIAGAQNGLQHLRNQVRELGPGTGTVDEQYRAQFIAAVNDDLNTPKALAIAQELLKSGLTNKDKRATILDFDAIFGLGLGQAVDGTIPAEVKKLAEERDRVRQAKDWAASDRLRAEIEAKGYNVEDTKEGTRITLK